MIMIDMNSTCSNHQVLVHDIEESKEEIKTINSKLDDIYRILYIIVGLGIANIGFSII